MSNIAESMGTPQGQNSNNLKIDWNAIISRVKEVVLDPKGVWANIKAESISIKDLYLKYFLVLAALPAISQMLVFHTPLFSSIVHHIMYYGFGLGMLFVGAFIIEKLAPHFGGSTDTVTAIKFLGFAAVPAWLGGVFILVPSWALFSLLSLVASVYSFYTFWQGLTPMTGVPEAKRVPFFVSMVVVGAIAGLVLGYLFAMVAPDIRPNITIDTPAGKFDLNEFQKNMEQFQKMVPQGEN